MFNLNRLYEYRRTQVQAANNYTQGAQEAITNYQQAIQRISNEARNKARQEYERYYGELQAAAAGDDPLERAGAAWLDYQQRYSLINQEYLTACQEQYQMIINTLQNLRLTNDTEALGVYIEMLEELRASLSAGPKKAASTSKKST